MFKPETGAIRWELAERMASVKPTTDERYIDVQVDNIRPTTYPFGEA